MTREQEKLERLRVIIADDVAEMRRSTRLMMTLVPAVEVVAIAHDGRQAVEMARQHKADIAILDINMPEMDGLTAIETLMRENPHISCIVMSAERDRVYLQRAISAGARGYLIKPFTSDALVNELQRVIKIVEANRKQVARVDQVRQQRDSYLIELATAYRKTRRTDDKAIAVYEELANDPNCDQRWLTTLAMIYVIRQMWHKLKLLAERLERAAK
jgi:YesN/AraC family two-component response regulator